MRVHIYIDGRLYIIYAHSLYIYTCVLALPFIWGQFHCRTLPGEAVPSQDSLGWGEGCFSPKREILNLQQTPLPRPQVSCTGGATRQLPFPGLKSGLGWGTCLPLPSGQGLRYLEGAGCVGPSWKCLSVQSRRPRLGPASAQHPSPAPCSSIPSQCWCYLHLPLPEGLGIPDGPGTAL